MEAKQVPLIEHLASVPADARLVIDDADGMGTRYIPVGRLCHEAAAAITALRERLAQPEQEPTAERAWFTIAELNAWADKKLSENPHWVMPKDKPERDEPPPEQDVPEASCGNMVPVGWLESPDGAFRENPLYKIKFPSKLLSWQVSLYTAPPQREWVDLTPKEIEACRQEGYLHSGLNAPFDFDRAAGAVLAKAKEKNT